MLDPDQVRAYAEADFNGEDADVIARLLELLPGGAPRIVDLGCGPGNISFRLARACPAAFVLGLDGSPTMLALACERLQQAPELSGRLRFELARLPLAAALPAEWDGGFTLLVSNSLLHHLHDPAVLWSSLRQLAAPNAFVYIRDLRRPADASALEALVQRHAADVPDVLRRDYAHSLRAAFRAPELRQQLRDCDLAHLAVAERLDQYLEVWGWLDPTATGSGLAC